MRRIIVVILSLLVASGCAAYQYIPSKHLVYQKQRNVDDLVFDYYQKQINGERQDVYQFSDTMSLIEGILTLYDPSKGFSLYYEMHEDIDVEDVMAVLRSISPQRKRMYYGNANDFGMLRTEPILPDEHDVAHEEVKRIIADEMKDIKTPREQVTFVHDYLVTNTAYDVAVTEDESLTQESLSLTVYGTLFHHLAVCEGYARTFLLFMQELGIPCLIIEAQGMNHAWNYVLIDGEWLFVDVTYDDPVPDQSRHLHQDYLLLNEEEFLAKGNHRFDDGVDIGIGLEEYKEIAQHLFGD